MTKSLGAGPKIVQILKEGYTLPFRTQPNLTRSPTVISCYANPHRNSCLLEALHQLMDKNAVELVHNQRSLGFFNRLFLVPKPNNKWRPILDLSKLNLFLKVEKFKMETPETIRTSLQQGEWVTSVDFKDAYFHIPIQEQSRKYLRFHVQGRTYQFKALPFGLSTAPLECVSKGGQADGHTQGYKDPPVPRQLVGESQIPSNLSPTHRNLNQNVPGLRLVGEYREIRAGTQTSLRLCRLPVRPQVRPGQTNPGPVAKPSGQNTSTSVTTGLSSPAVHVPDRSSNSHRKTGPPPPTAHETHTVASQKQLEGARIFGEDYPSTQVPAPPLTVVAGGKQCAPRSTITPSKTCSADLYRRIKRRVGRSLKQAHCKRVLVGAGKQTAHKLSGTQSSVSSSKRVRKSLCRQNNPSGNRQHYSSCVHKQGRGMGSGPLCALLWRILTWCSQRQVSLKARHIPGRLNVISDKLSRLGQTIQTEWSLLPEVFQKLCNRWHQPQTDLFATRFNHKLPQFVSPVPDSLAVAVDALTLPWEDLDAYAFPPTAILGKVVEKLQDSPCKRLILLALGWPNMPWFWELVAMSSQVPLSLPNLPNLLTQPFNQIPHRNLTNLNLHAWLLEPQQSKNRASLRQWQQELRLLKEGQPD